MDYVKCGGELGPRGRVLGRLPTARRPRADGRSRPTLPPVVSKHSIGFPAADHRIGRIVAPRPELAQMPPKKFPKVADEFRRDRESSSSRHARIFSLDIKLLVLHADLHDDVGCPCQVRRCLPPSLAPAGSTQRGRIFCGAPVARGSQPTKDRSMNSSQALVGCDGTLDPGQRQSRGSVASGWRSSRPSCRRRSR